MSDWEKFIDFLLTDFSLVDDEKKECEIIDIANEEMKKIDSKEIDTEYKKVFTEEMTQNLINLIYSEDWTMNDFNSYIEMIDNKNILDIRVSGKMLYIKTTQNINRTDLSKILRIKKEYIEEVPIYGKYIFYLIDTEKYNNLEKKSLMNLYDPKLLVTEIMTIAQNPQKDALKLKEIIEDALYENWEDYPDYYFTVEIEDQVIAIAFDGYIENAKQLFSKIFSINPKIFIEVSTPFQTILLIDTCRWDLDPEFGGEQWYH